MPCSVGGGGRKGGGSRTAVESFDQEGYSAVQTVRARPELRERYETRHAANEAQFSMAERRGEGRGWPGLADACGKRETCCSLYLGPGWLRTISFPILSTKITPAFCRASRI